MCTFETEFSQHFEALAKQENSQAGHDPCGRKVIYYVIIGVFSGPLHVARLH